MLQNLETPSIITIIQHTFTEYANESVTASGRPSGTATTNTVTPMMKNLTNSSANLLFHDSSFMTNFSTQKWTIRMMTVSTAMVEPKKQQKY